MSFPPFLKKEAIQYLALILVLFATLSFTLRLWRADLYIPFAYSDDGFLFSSIIKNTLAQGFYLKNPQLGAPFGAEYYDFPMADGVSFLLIKFFSLFTDHYAAVYNLIYLAGFFLAGIAAFIILKKMQIQFLLSLTGAVLYACLPFYFERLLHLFLATSYFIAPIILWAAIRLLCDKPPFFDATGTFKPFAPAWTITALLAGSSGAYFAFFGFLLTTLTALLGATVTRSLRPLIGGSLFAGLLALSFIANIYPNLQYRSEHGPNPQVAQRLPAETEIYGLRINQLLLPNPAHRVDVLRQTTRKYNESVPLLKPLINENQSASLGFIGGLGFLILILVSISGNKIKRLRDIPWLWELSAANLILLLYGTIGGFSSLFSLLVNPQIRSVNRVSVFIAFASLAAILLILQNAKLPAFPTMIRPAASLLLLGFGIWDQTSPAFIPYYENIKNEFQNDAQFIHRIEEKVGKNAMIYQLPYQSYPESYPLYREKYQAPIIGYLHSDSLKWSYGGMRGRPGDLALQALSEKPLQQQVAIITQAGFNGIYLERRAFPDHGQGLENQLRTLLQTEPLISQDGHLAFYPINSTKNPALTPLAEQPDAPLPTTTNP